MSDKIIYSLDRYSFLLGFIMPKNVRGNILNFELEYKLTDLFRFFNIKRPRRKESINCFI